VGAGVTQALGEGLGVSPNLQCGFRVHLRPELGRITPTLAFMRMDYVASIIYTNGGDKF
jgi:hypothetical protein